MARQRKTPFQPWQTKKAELIEKGFIVELQKNKNLRKANVYEFSEDWKRYEPP